MTGANRAAVPRAPTAPYGASARRLLACGVPPIPSRSDDPQRPPPATDPSDPSEPPAPPAGRTGRGSRRLFADLTPLRTSPHYRRLWFGNSASWVGVQMTALAISLQVFAITRSSFAVGLVGLFSLVPLVSFGLYGGAIADTLDRRRLGLVSSVGSTLLSALLAVSAVAHYHHVWLLYGIVALQSICFAMSSTARSSMVPRLLPAEQLPAANALNSLTSNLGLMAGPSLGGLVVGLWGYQSAYLVDVATFGFSLYAMWKLPPMLPQRAGGEGTAKRASVLDGLRFLATRPNLRMTFFSDLAAMVLAQPRALFPAVALLWFGGGAKTVGLLLAAPAIGAVLGGTFSGWLGRIHRHGVAIMISVAAWGAAIAAFGLSRQLWLGMFFLAVAGAADSVSMVFRSTVLQSAVPDELRGRLQGVFIVVVAGGPRLGDFLAGSGADLTSPAVTVVCGGLGCVLAVGLLALRWPGFARYDARDPQP